MQGDQELLVSMSLAATPRIDGSVHSNKVMTQLNLRLPRHCSKDIKKK